MINLFLAANCPDECIKVICSAATNENDLRIAEILCIAGVIAIFIICVTIYLLIRLNYKKEDKSVKRVLEDLLENDQKITELIKEKITVSNAEDVARELLSGTNSDFIKRVSDEVCRLKTKEIIKEELNKMIDEKGSEFIKSISEKVHPVNNNLQK